MAKFRELWCYELHTIVIWLILEQVAWRCVNILPSSIHCFIHLESRFVCSIVHHQIFKSRASKIIFWESFGQIGFWSVQRVHFLKGEPKSNQYRWDGFLRNLRESKVLESNLDLFTTDILYEFGVDSLDPEERSSIPNYTLSHTNCTQGRCRRHHEKYSARNLL